MEFEALLLALKSYQTYNPSGWVGLYRVLPMWAGIAACVLGLLLLLFGGGRVLFRVVAGPIGAVLGYVWTPIIIAKLGLTGVDPRMPSMAAAVLLVLGFLFPPSITFVGVGLPLGLIAGQIAGNDFLLGFAPAFIIGGLIAAILHHIVSSVVSSAVGAWLLVIGALAALHQFGGLVTAVANQPWGVIIAAALFAVAGSVYQIAMRPSPEEQEKLRAERAQMKQRQAERRALEKRWGAK
jgi:large-conductance mechanosensitive channel